MSTRYSDKPRCIQCGVRDTYSDSKMNYQSKNGVNELICADCLEASKSDELSTLKSREPRKSYLHSNSESKLYQDFIDEYLFGPSKKIELTDNQKTAFILKQEKQLAFRKKIFFGLLHEYKDLTESVNMLHQQRYNEINNSDSFM